MKAQHVNEADFLSDASVRPTMTSWGGQNSGKSNDNFSFDQDNNESGC